MADEGTPVGKIFVKVAPDTDQFRSETLSALRKIEREIRDVRVGIEVDIETDIDRLRRKIEDDLDNIKAEVEVEIDKTSEQIARARLARTARNRDVDLRVRVNEAAAAKAKATLAALTGTRALNEIGSDFADFVGNLDKSLPKIAAVSLAVTGLSAATLAGTSNTLAYGASLASIAPIALTLPGILGGLSVGLGSTFAVLKDFNKVIPEASDAISKLQDQMSDRFWAKAEEPIRRLGRELFPEFRRGILDTADALGDFFTGIADAASGQFGGELQGMLDDLNESIRIATSYADEFVGIIVKLGSVGAGNLPRLAGWFGDVARNFNEWLGRKGQAGLQGYVDEAIDALKDLGNVLRFTGRIFADLAKVAEAAGGGSLKTLANALENISKVTGSPKFQKGLTEVFEAAHKAMRNITSTSGPAFESFLLRLGNLLEVVLPQAGLTIGRVFEGIFDALDRPAVTRALIYAFEALDQAVQNIVPSLPTLARALSSIAVVVSDLGLGVSKALGPAIETVGQFVINLSDDIRPLITELTNLTTTIVTGISPGVLELGELLGNIAQAITPLVALLNNLAGGLGGIPGPLQAIIAILAASAFFGPAVTSRLTAFKTKMDAARVSAITFGAATVQGTTRLSAFGQAFYRLGQSTKYASDETLKAREAVRSTAKQYAGAALSVGLLAVASTGVAEKFGLSNTATLAMAGSLAGPWGAAVGAGIGLVVDLAARNNDLVASLKAANDALDIGSFTGYLANIRAAKDEARELSGEVSNTSLALRAIPIVGGNVSKLAETFGITGNAAGDAAEQITRADTAYQVATSSIAGLAVALGTAIGPLDGSAASARELEEVLRTASPAMDDLRFTADELTAAFAVQQGTATTAQAVLAAFNPTYAQMISSIAGATAAQEAETTSIRDNIAAMQEKKSATLSAFSAETRWGQAVSDANKFLKDTGQTAREAGSGIGAFSAKGRANRAVIDSLAQSWNNQSDTVRNAEGRYRAARETLISVARQMGLTRQQARDLANDILKVPDRVAIETGKAKQNLRELKQSAEDVKNVKANLTKYKETLDSDLKAAKSKADKGSKDVKQKLEGEIKKAKADLSTLQQSIQGAVSKARGIAATGGRSVGTALKQGIIAGFSGTAQALAAAAASAVSQAVAAAKAKAEVNSPSKLMMREVGSPLGEGIIKGFEEGVKPLKRAINGAIEKALVIPDKYRIDWFDPGVINPNAGPVKFLGNIYQYLRSINTEGDVANEKILRNLDDQITKYREMVKERLEQIRKLDLKGEDSLIKQRGHIVQLANKYNNVLSQMEKVRQKYQALKAEALAYAESVKESVIASANPTGINLEEGQPLTFDIIESNMSKARDEALQFAAVVKELANAGLSKEILQQIIDAGPTAGLEAAKQIFLAGQEGIDSLNAIMKDLELAGKDLGKTAAIAVFDEALKETADQLATLQDKLDTLGPKLEQKMENIFNALAKKIREGRRKLKEELDKLDDLGGKGKGSPTPSANPLSASASARVAFGSAASSGTTFNYYAAPGPQLTAEEQLFEAANRGRMALAS